MHPGVLVQNTPPGLLLEPLSLKTLQVRTLLLWLLFGLFNYGQTISSSVQSMFRQDMVRLRRS